MQAKNNNSPAILTPKSYSEIEPIANELIENIPVILDLTNTDANDVKRICDFLSGVCYALNGEVKKIATLVFLFSPKRS